MARIAARHHSHSQAEDPRIGMISRPGLQQGTTATHKLERAKDKHGQQTKLWQGTTATHILESQGQA